MLNQQKVPAVSNSTALRYCWNQRIRPLHFTMRCFCANPSVGFVFA
jgi:hypothetical protein